MLRLILLALLASTAFTLPARHKDEVDDRSETSEHVALHSGEREESASDSLAEASSLSDVELVAGDDESEEDDEGEDEEGDPRGDSQHFFPSFAPLFSSPPLGHSRPHGFDTESSARSSSFDSPFRFRSAFPSSDERVLGSGNFGVIKGGTYYSASGDEQDDFDPAYYRGGNNGHGRPPYFRGNPQPAYRHGGDFFAGFRDFADITTPAKPAYSQYFVVYANRNSTAPQSHSGPKNIIEQLALLDKVDKISKNKNKLNIFKDKQNQVEYKKKNKSPKEAFEPLLALS